MHKALSYLGSLPEDTVVHNGHEYTKSNLAFGAHIDPQNPGIERLRKLAENKITTGRSTIGDEKEWNVFMRLGSGAVRYASVLYEIIAELNLTLWQNQDGDKD